MSLPELRTPVQLAEASTETMSELLLLHICSSLPFSSSACPNTPPMHCSPSQSQLRGNPDSCIFIYFFEWLSNSPWNWSTLTLSPPHTFVIIFLSNIETLGIQHLVGYWFNIPLYYFLKAHIQAWNI